MKKYLPILLSCPLFHGLSAEQLEQLLSSSGIRQLSADKDCVLLRRGEITQAIGLVLSGCIHVVQEDFWGNRNLLAAVEPGELFGETYACLPQQPLNVSALAAEPSQALFLPLESLLNSGQETAPLLARNLLGGLAQKNRMLQEKLTHISQRSTRSKLLSYLSAESLRQGKAEFNISLNRQQLADYLSVERSAMSTELSKMQKEGLIQVSRKHFKLL